jgi:hypothetical protein
MPSLMRNVNQFHVRRHALRQIGAMENGQAFQYGKAITDVRQAARQLRKTMLAHGESSAWFALGFWRVDAPTPEQVEQTLAALDEHAAYVDYEGYRQPADMSWVEWLLYAPIDEQRRQALAG